MRDVTVTERQQTLRSRSSALRAPRKPVTRPPDLPRREELDLDLPQPLPREHERLILPPLVRDDRDAADPRVELVPEIEVVPLAGAPPGEIVPRDEDRRAPPLRKKHGHLAERRTPLPRPDASGEVNRQEVRRFLLHGELL